MGTIQFMLLAQLNDEDKYLICAFNASCTNIKDKTFVPFGFEEN